MTQPMISVAGFSKTFRTDLFKAPKPAAIDITFEVAPGEIFGFLGPNGAGKTTTIKALLGLIRPTSGELKIAGHRAHELGWRGLVGYLPEHPNFYEYLTALELVTWFGSLAGQARHEAERAATRQLTRVGLAHAMSRPLRTYSKGMLQRTGLAQALMGAPKLLILDEPMTGLDPMGRKEVRDLMLELRAEGTTIMFSTHILSDVEVTADRVAILDKGRVLRTGLLSDLFKDTARSVTLRLSSVSEERWAQLRAKCKVSRRYGDSVEVEVPTIDETRAVISAELAAGARLEAVVPNREDLETLFVRTLAEHGRARGTSS